MIMTKDKIQYPLSKDSKSLFRLLDHEVPSNLLVELIDFLQQESRHRQRRIVQEIVHSLLHFCPCYFESDGIDGEMDELINESLTPLMEDILFSIRPLDFLEEFYGYSFDNAVKLWKNHNCTRNLREIIGYE